ncbi:hypothetical protein HDU93_007253 [Gonapodya sp. JEL0774]|nr:hypothetical protein HDU93_007253 [Gonapodya sp. JEL0774]
MCFGSTSTGGNAIIAPFDPITMTDGPVIVNISYPVRIISPLQFVSIPRGQRILGNPDIRGTAILQKLYVGIYDGSGEPVGTASLSVTIETVSSFMDLVKKTMSANSLLYILSTKAEILALSGFAGNFTAQFEALKKINPSTGVTSLKTIFDFDRASYPLLNISSRTVYDFANGDLASIPDTTWNRDGTLFKVTSLRIYGFQFIIVVAAPLSDYVGDTLQLRSNLESDGRRSTLIVILSAVGVIIVLAILSLMFSWLFITKPLEDILDMMKKATKFDFSDIREGKTSTRLSVVKEVYSTQDNFLMMIKAFADALKRK